MYIIDILVDLEESLAGLILFFLTCAIIVVFLYFEDNVSNNVINMKRHQKILRINIVVIIILMFFKTLIPSECTMYEIFNKITYEKEKLYKIDLCKKYEGNECEYNDKIK